VSPESAEALKQFKRLWVHEVFRVFYDRLVDTKDRNWLIEQARVTTKAHLSESLDAIFSHLREGRGEEEDASELITNEDMRRSFFGDYMDTEAEEPHLREYGEITDIPK
jgi:dynein heavy chain